MTSFSRDIYAEFFNQPHSCIVSKPLSDRHLPTVSTLQEMLDFVDRIGTDEDYAGGEGTRNEQYGWGCREITEKDFPEKFVSFTFSKIPS